MSDLWGFTSQKYFLQAMKLYFAFFFNPMTMSDCSQITYSWDTNRWRFVLSSEGSAVCSNEGTSRQLHKYLQPSWGSINALSLHCWRPERSARASTLRFKPQKSLQRQQFTAGDHKSNHIQQKLTIHQKLGPDHEQQDENQTQSAIKPSQCPTVINPNMISTVLFETEGEQMHVHTSVPQYKAFRCCFNRKRHWNYWKLILGSFCEKLYQFS